jgi:hypothetical protein
MQYVTIPFDFEDLTGDEKAVVVPICIERADRDGREIAWGWFEAVEAAQEPLRRLARIWLDDVWRVSELAEATVHTLWYRHRFELGIRPASRVLAQAKWYARDLQAGTWQRRRGVVVGLEGMDELFRSRVLTDPAHYEDLYHREMYFKSLGEKLEDAGQAEVSEILKCVRNGCSWAEIGEQLGKDPDAARMKFRRWINRFLPGAVSPSVRRPV